MCESESMTQCNNGNNHEGRASRSKAMNLRIRILTALTVVCTLSTGQTWAETSTYQYDGLHRLTYVTYDDGSWIYYEYDAVGNRLVEVMNSDADVGYLHLTVEPTGSGSVSSDPNDPNDSNLVWQPLSGDVAVTATETGICEFDHWTGDVPSGHETDNPLTINMSTSRYVHLIAHFTSPAGHMDEDCDDNGVPDGCEWEDTNGNDALDACDPLIARSPTALDPNCAWGAAAADQTFDVWNAGLPGTELAYAIECSEPWLWCDPNSGTSTGEADTVAVHYDTASLAVGQHAASITISDLDAGNTPQVIDVTLTVTGYAAICRDDGMLSNTCEYGEIAAYQTFDLWNCGAPGTELTYDISDDADWLWCEWPGDPLTDETATVTVYYDSAALPAGQHWGTITITAEGASNDPQELIAVLTVACPGAGWLEWDMNYDGFVSIIGDVPPFVDCVYFGDCYCPGPGCVCPGDCNASGFLSIIGDVECFVDCVYFDDCTTRGSAPLPIPHDTFTIGGAVYTDINDPLGTGLAGVRIRVARVDSPQTVGETSARAEPLPAQPEITLADTQPVWLTTSGTLGLWQVSDLHPGRYVVSAGAPGYVLEHVEAGAGTGLPRVKITVSLESAAANQSIQFLASE